MVQYRSKFLEYSSSSDNGTWNKTGFFRDVTIDIPAYPEQVAIVKAYDKSENLDKIVRRIETRIEELLMKQITQD